MSARPIVWTIAGSDSGGGAGVQADLRALDAFGVHGCSAIAAITAQNSSGVEAIESVSPKMLDAQLAALASDMPPAAIKTGMLGSVANLEVVVRWVDRLREANPSLALVVDPVLRATTGADFADEGMRRAYREQLVPRATLVTPNRAEASALLGAAVADREQVERAAKMLREAGAAAVAITGGDAGGDSANDYVDAPWASGWLCLPRVTTPHHHGTGCVFAASAAAALALGFVEVESLVLAKMATTQALRESYGAGAGAGPVHPSPAFASLIDNLPDFVARPDDEPHAPFAPLRDTDPGLYAIVDSAEWIERVLTAGLKTVQLRIKDRAHPKLREEVRRAVAACERTGAQLFVNDHWQIALEERAYGVHLGQEDLAEADLAAIARAGVRLGISTHSYWEVSRAWALRPSYIACGPIHPTAAKAMPWIPQGNANLAYWCNVLPLPVVAIAGMDAERAAEAVRCGAASVAVISGITAAAQPEQAIRLYRDAMDSAARGATPPPRLPRPTLRR